MSTVWPQAAYRACRGAVGRRIGGIRLLAGVCDVFDGGGDLGYLHKAVDLDWRLHDGLYGCGPCRRQFYMA